MKLSHKALLASALISLVVPCVFAGGGEFMNLQITGSSSNESRPAVSLRKKADFITLELTFVNDSRMSDARLVEIRKSVRMALDSAKKDGRIVLQDGRNTIDDNNFRVDPTDSRNDTASFKLFLAIPISEKESAEKLTDDLIAFAKALKFEGRTLIYIGQPGLSIKDAERFRMELIQAISADIAASRAAFGKDVEFSVSGLDQKLQVRAVSVDEVDISLPYSFSIKSAKKTK
ncbi:MAG TPA: hypothetical protein PKI32_06430 [Opitutales bacterium]|nr:hypothetical protein [Opitutales bacterium]